MIPRKVQPGRRVPSRTILPEHHFDAFRILRAAARIAHAGLCSYLHKSDNFVVT